MKATNLHRVLMVTASRESVLKSWIILTLICRFCVTRLSPHPSLSPLGVDPTIWLIPMRSNQIGGCGGGDKLPERKKGQSGQPPPAWLDHFLEAVRVVRDVALWGLHLRWETEDRKETPVNHTKKTPNDKNKGSN